MDEREKEIKDAAKEFLIERGYPRYAVKVPRSDDLKAQYFDRAITGQVTETIKSKEENIAISIVTNVMRMDAIETAKRCCTWYPPEDDTVTAELVREECGVKTYKVDPEHPWYAFEGLETLKVTVSFDRKGQLFQIRKANGECITFHRDADTAKEALEANKYEVIE